MMKRKALAEDDPVTPSQRAKDGIEPLDGDDDGPLWEIQTDHDPPLTLKMTWAWAQQMPLLQAAVGFREGQVRRLVLSAMGCATRSAWYGLFQHLEHPTVLAPLDMDALSDLWHVYDYFVAGDGGHILMQQLKHRLTALLEITGIITEFTVAGLLQCVKLTQGPGWAEHFPAFNDRSRLIRHLMRLPLDEAAGRRLALWGSRLNEALRVDGVAEALRVDSVAEALRVDGVAEALRVDGVAEALDPAETKQHTVANDTADLLWECWVELQRTLARLSLSVPDLAPVPVRRPDGLATTMKQRCGLWDWVQTWLGPSCVWSGGSLAAVQLGQPFVPGMDLDFWVFDIVLLERILQTLDERLNPYLYYVVHESVITVYVDATAPIVTPPLQFIYAGPDTTPLRIVHNFDLDYLQSYSDGKEIIYTPEALWALTSRTIHYTAPVLSQLRVDKVARHGLKWGCTPTVTTSSRTLWDYACPDSRWQGRIYQAQVLRRLFPHWTVALDIRDVKFPLKPFRDTKKRAVHLHHAACVSRRIAGRLSH